MMLVERRIAKVSDARASDQFRRYKREPTHAVRKAEIKENETLRALKQAWQNFELVKDDMAVVDPRKSYQKALELIRSFAYTKEDIENFNLALGEFQNEKDFAKRAGLFLSALINNGSDSTYTIFTRHLDDLGLLGIYNRKTIIVEGDAGYDCAALMDGGTVIVKGNAGERLGNCMKGKIIVYFNSSPFSGIMLNGGSIKIKGNASNYVGLKMRGGKIIVQGNCGHTLGAEMHGGSILVMGDVGITVACSMYGGEIHINGNMSGPLFEAAIRAGSVYHKGKQIWPIVNP